MFLIKNLLIGLGSVGIIGVGGYGIYSATKSGDEGSKAKEYGDSVKNGQEQQTNSLTPANQPNQQQAQLQNNNGSPDTKE